MGGRNEYPGAKEGRGGVDFGEHVGHQETFQLVAKGLVFLQKRGHGADHAEGAVLVPVIPLGRGSGVVAI